MVYTDQTEARKHYTLINSYIPRNARIVDIGCGYGYLSHMLALVSPERQILGIDYDAGKIEIASNCISKQLEQLHCCRYHRICIRPCDVFILSDVLHYCGMTTGRFAQGMYPEPESRGRHPCPRCGQGP